MPFVESLCCNGVNDSYLPLGDENYQVSGNSNAPEVSRASRRLEGAFTAHGPSRNRAKKALDYR